MIVLVNLYTSVKSKSFSFLEQTIKQYGYPYKVVNNIDQLPQAGISAIILSGSSIRFTKSLPVKHVKKINLAIAAHLMNPNVPILGICFGFQLLNLMYGGVIVPFGRLICQRIDDLEYCFNDFIAKPGKGFKIRKKIKIDGKDVICHVSHKEKNMVGYLFHSENTDQDKHGYIKRFLNKINS